MLTQRQEVTVKFGAFFNELRALTIKNVLFKEETLAEFKKIYPGKRPWKQIIVTLNEKYASGCDYEEWGSQYSNITQGKADARYYVILLYWLYVNREDLHQGELFASAYDRILTSLAQKLPDGERKPFLDRFNAVEDIQTTKVTRTRPDSVVEKGSLSNAAHQSSAPEYWGVESEPNPNFDQHACAVNLSEGQPSVIGSALECTLELTLEKGYLSGVYFGFTKVRVTGDANRKGDLSIDYGLVGTYPTYQIKDGVFVEHKGTRAQGTVEVTSTKGILSSSFVFQERPFVKFDYFDVDRQSPDYLVVAEIDKYERASISDLDGNSLPSKNKEAVIDAIIKATLQEKDSDRWLRLASTTLTFKRKPNHLGAPVVEASRKF